jgi:VanZ family protein
MKKILPWLLSFAWAYLIFYLTSIPSPQVTDNELISFIISGSEHFFFFGVQAALLFFALPKKILKFSSTHLAVVLTSIFGLLIEYHQLTLAGRTADPLDWILDTLGAILFLVILKQLLVKYHQFIKI